MTSVERSSIRQIENRDLNEEEKPPLTPRKMEILELAAEGKTNSEIARKLKISRQVVKNHFSSPRERTKGILARLDACSRREAVVKAIVELRLLDPEELVSEEELERLKLLSEREGEVLSCLADPSLPSLQTTDREIGDKLGGISPQTVRNTLRSIYEKLGIKKLCPWAKSTRAAVIFLAYQQRQESTALFHGRLRGRRGVGGR